MTMTDIVRSAEHLERAKAEAEARAERAAECGAKLAAEVYRYVEHPQEVGRAALREAYSRFMAAHAGNFGPGTREHVTDGSPCSCGPTVENFG